MALRLIVGLPFFFLLLSLPTSSQAGEREKFVVGKYGEGRFRTIQAAVAAASRRPRDERIEIHIEQGVYEENVVVNRTNVELVGDGIGKTIITGHRSTADGATTFASATVVARQPAVAFRSSADRSAFHHCKFEGYQDTLYAHTGRQFYRDCMIVGAVDFVFGRAAAVFQNSTIYLRPRPGSNSSVVYITAHGRSHPDDKGGFVFDHCRVVRESGVKSGQIQAYLGRPWRKYARTVFMNSFLDGSIVPAGWARWGYNDRPKTIYYAEYNNSGPGSDTIGRVKWPGYHLLTDEDDVAQFSVHKFLLDRDNWLRDTNIPSTN
ncbi:hypothetical protein Nepgr_002441 [Nepenthes gracilis]|uniref:Pectinesterase n=1 Tax=Nepenthes gracilis TaxID=150966 RepID=A0AAD3RWW6_NEPGR|nr:hypothetical protein Nepgr_002441 [Nepenthes gracilis]